jgi:hypothetical protein
MKAGLRLDCREPLIDELYGYPALFLKQGNELANASGGHALGTVHIAGQSNQQQVNALLL